MKKPKQNDSADLKAQVVLEALEGNKAPIQIGIERGIYVTSLNNWVREAKRKLSAIFKEEVQQPEIAAQKEFEQLNQKIGQLTVEVDFLPRRGCFAIKKASGRWK